MSIVGSNRLEKNKKKCSCIIDHIKVSPWVMLGGEGGGQLKKVGVV
jgi:hypothetical protein